MVRYFKFVLIGLLFLSGCQTHYQLALKHFKTGEEYYKKDRTGKVLIEYGKVLDVMEQEPNNVSFRFLRAALYHHLHLINAPVLWQSLSEKNRLRSPTIARFFSSASESPNFLTLAFDEILKLERDFNGKYPERIDDWLLVERYLIIADFLIQKSNETNLFARRDGSGGGESGGDSIPAAFVANIRQYVFYEVAKNFYLAAWAETVRANYENPHSNIGLIASTVQKQLKDIFRLLDVTTRTLSYLERNKDFLELFRNKERHYFEVIDRMEQMTLTVPVNGPFSADNPLGEKIAERYLLLDDDYHFKEARAKIAGVIEEVVTQKSAGAYQSLLDAFQHLIILSISDWMNEPANQQAVNYIAEDIYVNLYRMSEPVPEPPEKE